MSTNIAEICKMSASKRAVGPRRNTKDKHPLLLRLLSDVGGLDISKLDDAWEACGRSTANLETTLVDSLLVDDSLLAELYSAHHLIPLFDPLDWSPPPVDTAIAALLPAEFCRQHALVPIADDGSTIEIAIVSPDAFSLKDEVRHLSRRQMRPLFSPLSVVQRLLSLLYPVSSNRYSEPSTDRELITFEEAKDAEIEFHPEATSVTGSAATYVQKLFERAIEKRATDIHVEPFRDSIRVRLRVSGKLLAVAPPHALLAFEVISWIKKLAHLPTRVTPLAQQGCIRIRDGRRRFEVSVHCYPTLEGERIVMQSRGRHLYPRTLGQLGMLAEETSQLIEVLENGPGLLIVTGPRGGGKRTTLYSCLHYLNSCDRNVCSIEDQIELNIPGVNQTPIHPESGWTYSRAVQEILRQDPDVIMIGDLADSPTLHAAIAAISRGSLVIASVEAEDSESCCQRLRTLTADHQQLASMVRGVLAQYCVRRPCAHCNSPPSSPRSNTRESCCSCHGSGYRGKSGNFTLHTDAHWIREQLNP